ncbi:MAG: alpha-galactosidase, partial [Bacteroidota bacterium]
DDGYQRAAGDWETNEKFPHGHRWLTDQIHQKGFLAGLWLAPFAVGARSELFKDHPDWVLKSPEGSPLKVVSIENWGGEVYVLDATLPDVKHWLTDLFRKVTHKWGYDYVKIDYLFFAALGTQYSKPVSTAQAYRMGMEAIRKGVGSKKFILGCGAPMGISVGFVDGMRIGPDVEASWNGVLPTVAAAANRYYYHNKVWFNDPDCLVVRDPLTLDQARVWAAVVTLSGQMSLLGDKLADIPPERIALLAKTLPLYKEGAIPVDLFEPEEELGMTIRNAEGKEFRLSRSVQFNAGDSNEWIEPDFDDNNWQTVSIPSPWENYDGLENYDGYGWYRLRFYLPSEWEPSDLTFLLGRVGNCDETFLNRTMIGATGSMPPKYQDARSLFRAYLIPKAIVNWKGENVLAVRVYDGGGQGGIYSFRKLHLPKIWNLTVKKKSEEWNVVGVFNWESYSQRIEIALEKLGLQPGGKYLAYEFWGDEFLGEIESTVELDLEPTSSKVLAIHQLQERPVLLSTSRHITQGAVDIKKLTWDEKRTTLEGKSQNLRRGEYTLVVWVPPGYKFTRAVTAVDYETTTISQSIVKVTLKLGKDKPLAWKLQFERTVRSIEPRQNVNPAAS